MTTPRSMANPVAVIQKLQSNIQKGYTCINQIESLAKLVGSDNDSDSVRRKISDLEKQIKDLLLSTQSEWKELKSQSSSGDAKRQHEKLADEMLKLGKQFKEVMQNVLRKQKEFELPKAYTTNEYDGDDTRVMYSKYDNAQEQKQVTISQSVEAVQERHKQFMQLEKDIVDLNEMFRDLAVITYEQGEVIDSIENNINNTEMSVVDANSQLKSATKHQSSARRKKFCLAMIIVVALVIIAVIVVVSIKPWAK